jgi:hypothetical protein
MTDHLKAIEMAVASDDGSNTESPRERASSRAAFMVADEIVWLETEYDRLNNVVASERSGRLAAESEAKTLRQERKVLCDRLLVLQDELNIARESLIAIQRQADRGVGKFRKPSQTDDKQPIPEFLQQGPHPELSGKPFRVVK